MKEFVYLQCGKIGLAKSYEVDTGRKKYCSVECYNKSKKGRTLTDEHKHKISMAGKGKPKPPNHGENVSKGKTGKHRKDLGARIVKRTCLQCNTIFETTLSQVKYGHAKYCSLECARSARIGQTISQEQRYKIAVSLTGKTASSETRIKMSESRTAERNPNWCGGVSFGKYCPKFNEPFKERVRRFFNYTCVLCGSPQNGEKLHVHHVHYIKSSCCSSDAPRLFVTLCRSCHMKTNSKNNREMYREYFTDLINNEYEGKCYLPKKLEKV